jgi:hypothetical protein
MRHWLRSHLTYANVISTLCLFLLLGGGTAVALTGSNTVFSDDIVDNQVYSADVRNDTLSGGGLGAADLKPSSVGTSEVANGTLNDEDIGEGTFVNFAATIGVVPAQHCKYVQLTNINAPGDHLFLTASYDDTSFDLDYGIQYAPTAPPYISVCNPTTAAIDDATTHFNLLVIDAQ